MADTTLDTLSFAAPDDFGNWLAERHADSPGIWIRIYKVASGTPSVTWGDCVVEAIRYGWIDGQRRALDEVSFVQRLTPRKPGSNWSAKNVGHAERLIAEGRMAEAGMSHVEAARADGRWANAYAGSAAMVLPQDFFDALEGLPEAKAFFATLNRQNAYAVYHRLHTATKPETRAKRLGAILAQLGRGERFH
jgi:uncharacterized protein YdeI (YjbR/CyaY-like superfamily)